MHLDFSTKLKYLSNERHSCVNNHIRILLLISVPCVSSRDGRKQPVYIIIFVVYLTLLLVTKLHCVEG
jgi:hypothetical protein